VKKALRTVTQSRQVCMVLMRRLGQRQAWGLRWAPCCDQQLNEPSRTCKG